ncbi:MAG: ABC transporter permease [Kiritimatiellae bacterium]|nr:ABC transporter permease [Kiritimatiellia bacterium]
MNPLSPLTYYRRHKRQTLLQVSLVALVTLGICLMVGMSYPILEHTSIVILGPLSHFSMVYPAVDLAPDPTIVSQIRAHPDVARVIPENGLRLLINVPSLVSTSSMRVLGLSEGDVQALMDTCGLRLKEGRLLRPRTNELSLSEEISNALGLHIGDQIDRSVHKQYYAGIPTPLMLVGILESEPSVSPEQRARVAIVSYEYLDSHETYAPRQSGLLVIAREDRKAAVDDFVETTIRSPRTRVETHKQRSEYLARTRRTFNLVFGAVDCLVAVVVALVIGVINQVALMQRVADLGVLHAIGHRKAKLIRRLTLETAFLAGAGWLAGLALSWLALTWLNANFYAPRGVELNPLNLAPLWFAIPIPLAVVAFVTFSIVRIFARLDTVAIVERGKLSLEARDRRPAAKSSSLRSLSPWTFYLRHRRRGLTSVVVMGLMILGVAFPVFSFGPTIDVQKPFFLNYLRYVSEVSPGVGRAVDPGVAGQIRAHPAVEHVILTRVLNLTVNVPPVSVAMTPIYAVSEQDMVYLADLFEMRLQEGRLPCAHSNEIVLSESLALNRGLRVGDTVGRPVFEQDEGIPTEMVVVGIFAFSDVALGLASSEYLAGHELYASQPTQLLVAPVEGRKAELDAWLEESVASMQTLVQTYDAKLRELDQVTRGVILMLTAVESVVAIVAVIALAALNYIYFTQRRDEFGILHAVGHGRPWLVFRTMKETVSVVAAAWLVGAALCLAGLVYTQAKVYVPAGLRLNLFDMSPWLFTLPIPLAVVVASTGTIAWMLSRLDPVSIVERR